MGYYVNPIGKTKELWLKEKTMPLLRSPKSLTEIPDDMQLLCWVFNTNMGFSAVAIIYNERELQDWLREDGRPKIFFLVTKQLLRHPDSGADTGWE